MASHVQGIAITIKAFLPTGKTLDEQFEALSIVKDAHASGDYSAVLKTAKIDEVKAEQKTRRVEDAAATTEATTETETVKTEESGEVIDGAQEPGETVEEVSEEEVPKFLRNGKGKKPDA